jgi:alpha 1,2-mannosyltransferase
MLINPQFISAIPRLVVIPLFLLTCYLYFLPGRYADAPTFKPVNFYQGNLTEARVASNASIIEFWQKFASKLLAAKPRCDPLQVVDEYIQDPNDHFNPLNIDKKHPQRLAGFTNEVETVLFKAHYSMRRSAQHLAPKLPFFPGSTGIVTTANSECLPILLVSLRMLRRTGCKLPLEVFIKDWTQYDPTVCDIVLPSLHARCIVLSDMYDTASSAKKPDHYQYKILSILFTSFQNVLFLESDAFPVYDPSVLFTIPPFTTHGLVTWPDFHALTVSEHFYHIAAIPGESAFSRLSTESGQVLLNKEMHRESLLMMVYYNYYGQNYYYPLLCQGGHDAGDKETFVQAAMAVGLPWYQVRTAPVPLGRFVNGTFRGTVIAQADPGLDYEYLPPFPSHLHPSSKWEKTDLAHPVPAVEKKLNITRHAPRPPRPVFLRQNMLKMDPKKVLGDKKEIMFEPDGTPHRMWGSKEDMVRLMGFDVERRLWDVVAEEACREDRGSEVCRDVGAFVREVFGWMDSIDRPW